jgi:uncharacterized protein YhaN
MTEATDITEEVIRYDDGSTMMSYDEGTYFGEELEEESARAEEQQSETSTWKGVAMGVVAAQSFASGFWVQEPEENEATTEPEVNEATAEQTEKGTKQGTKAGLEVTAATAEQQPRMTYRERKEKLRLEKEERKRLQEQRQKKFEAEEEERRRQEEAIEEERRRKEKEAFDKAAVVYSGERDEHGLPDGMGRCVYRPGNYFMLPDSLKESSVMTYEGEFRNGVGEGAE